ncbi:glycosyltransferase family 4 protein [Aerococcaceae bacterium INB8]|uniref:Glycosyltransferase family 4 protein n=1 Tax=Ruoffia halotolerans TaxID=2748684 RepID=A0A839A928_9LACT|nr:glycosyltransferase family 4 protein [Ruoffia halotolerans]MBA5730203.1 glycosyltransferase family 4 protein [Ruoffia halotolerans]
MKILFLSLGKLEDIDTPGIYTDLMREMRDNGHDVYVVSSRERRLKQPTILENQSGIHILKVKIGNIKKTNIIEKGLSTLLIEHHYLKAIKQNLSDVKFDLVMYSTPPITFEKVVSFIKNRDNAISYLLLKDIFPQNAVDLNMFKRNSLIHAFFKRKEKQLYQISDFIGTMSPANRDYLLANNPEIDPTTVEVCPNTITPINIEISLEEKIRLRKKYTIPVNKVLYIYGGNLGKPQGIDYLIECLKKNEQNAETFILIVGNGTEFKKLKNFFDTNKPQNAKLMNELPKDEYDILSNTADVGLIFLDHRFTIPNFPSRLLSYMQASLPVIAATDKNTDIGQIIEENEIGYWNESTDVEAFNNNLLKLTDKNMREKFGKNGRIFLNNNYTSKDACKTIIKHME